MEHKNFKIIFRSLLILVLCPLLILSGCGKTTNSGSLDGVMFYVYTYDGESIKEDLRQIDGYSESEKATALMKALTEENVIASDVELIGIEELTKARMIILNLNDRFSAYLATKDETGQKAVMQCVANTFIKNYNDIDQIVVTSGGENVATTLCDFTGAIGFNQYKIQTLSSDGGEVVTEPAVPEEKKRPGYVPQHDMDDGKKHVAITFDDGPSAKYTEKIVDKLKQYDATATFFVVGNLINDSNADAMRYAVENGCEIQIHGWTHEVYYSSCSDETFEYELSETAKKIEETVGVKPTLMRPIGGAITPERTVSCGYPIIIWNVDSEDWKHKKDSDCDAIVRNVMSTVSDGSIILMHEIYENSYNAFCQIIDRLYDEGYVVMSVSELFGSDGLTTGSEYYSLDYIIDRTDSGESESED